MPSLNRANSSLNCCRWSWRFASRALGLGQWKWLLCTGCHGPRHSQQKCWPHRFRQVIILQPEIFSIDTFNLIFYFVLKIFHFVRNKYWHWNVRIRNISVRLQPKYYTYDTYFTCWTRIGVVYKKSNFKKVKRKWQKTAYPISTFAWFAHLWVHWCFRDWAPSRPSSKPEPNHS